MTLCVKTASVQNGSLSCVKLINGMMSYYIMGRENASYALKTAGTRTPFKRYDGNPIILPRGSGFESKDVFNPACIKHEGKIRMLYRAEDKTGIGIWNGTSRLGLAESSDGINFNRYKKPVLEPEFDYELKGGCEDPRVVRVGDTFYLTYTGYKKHTEKGYGISMCMATSKNLKDWKKHGPIIPNTKSGAILNRKVNGKYVMYFGEGNISLAYSDDLLHWDIKKEPVLTPREGHFDSKLVEPGPPPIMTDEGIFMIYNGDKKDGRRYCSGAVLFDKNDPSKVLKRCETPFLEPEKEWEINGQISNVVFSEGLVKHAGKWFLYYGGADSNINVATCPEGELLSTLDL